MATAYEWTIEEMDGDDVIDSHCFPSYEEAKRNLGPTDALVLRKLKSNRDCDSVDDFAYAYVVGGKLPVTFSDGAWVPAKYLREANS